jgi:hypothetical protein
MNQENFSPISLTLLCLVACAGLLAAGLWPFNFRAENHVALIAGGGLKFSALGERSKQDLGGLVFTPAPLVCPPERSCNAGQLSIELRLKADSDESSCLKRILDLRKPTGGESFYIGQWKSNFVVRSFNTPPAGGKPFREIGVSGVLVAGLESIVTLTSGPDRTVILVDGQPL